MQKQVSTIFLHCVPQAFDNIQFIILLVKVKLSLMLFSPHYGDVYGIGMWLHMSLTSAIGAGE
jgi:hypothetical protein